MINENNDLIKLFYPNAYSSNITIKKKFLFAMSQIFNNDFDLKDEKITKKSLILLGDIFDLMNMKKTLLEISKEYTKAFDYIFKLLFVPFSDIEIEALNLLRRNLFDSSIY